ncbi:MAG TPA: spore coat protein U domain-containing protein [Anaeromyxobacteraceae bacterium]|nr:spore coat protein U domain-containing protein [Anaeromyxobacteraceae bacterium]
MTRIAAVAVAALLLAAPGATHAGNASASFTVSAKVSGACTITAQDIALAAYDPNAATGASATGNVNLTCTKGTVYSVALTTTSGWTMSDGAGSTLNYEIRQGSTTTPWNATSTVGGTAASKAQFSLVATLFVPPGQDITVGNYSDKVTATVNF